MIHAQAGTTTNNRTLKKYVVAVLGGVLLGGTYAVAGPTPETQAQLRLPKSVLATPSHMAKSFRSGDDCASGTASVVPALPMSVSGRGAELRPANTGEPICTWAI